jgi:hypothetical protein
MLISNESLAIYSGMLVATADWTFEDKVFDSEREWLFGYDLSIAWNDCVL